MGIKNIETLSNTECKTCGGARWLYSRDVIAIGGIQYSRIDPCPDCNPDGGMNY